MGFKNHNFTKEQLNACRDLNNHNQMLEQANAQARIDFFNSVQDSSELQELRSEYFTVGSAEIAELMWDLVLPADYEREIKRLHNSRKTSAARPDNVIDMDQQQPKKKGWFGS